MALTLLQNCQRTTIFIWFFTLVMVIILLTIRIIKRKIDIQPKLPQSQTAGPQYKESQSQQNIPKEHFDDVAAQANEFTEYDTCTERFMKKMGEVNVTFNPLLLGLPLSFVLGRSYAFVLVIYFAAGLFCLFFNVFKVHRACVEYRLSRLFLQSIWIFLALLLIINIWITNPSPMLYLIH